MTQTPAGWHPDPQDPTQQRYWDGAAWTSHTAPAVVPAPPAEAAGAPEVPRATAYQAPVAPAAPQYYQQQPAKKSHTLRNVIIIVVVVFVAGTAGCLALIGGAANQIDKDIKKDDANARADVTLGACPVKGQYGTYRARLTIKNSSKKAQTYTGTVYVTKGGEQIASGSILEDVAGSATSRISVVLTNSDLDDLTPAQVSGATCSLKSVGAFETE